LDHIEILLNHFLEKENEESIWSRRDDMTVEW